MSIILNFSDIYLKKKVDIVSADQIFDIINEYMITYNRTFISIHFSGNIITNMNQLTNKLNIIKDESILYISSYKNYNTVDELFEKIKNKEDWKKISKTKVTANLSFGDQRWFLGNYKKLNNENKDKLEKMMSEYLSEKNGYLTRIKINEDINENMNKDQYIFYESSLSRLLAK